ncbi:hypothetical protein EVAR_14479_1 [Eumeta japonica]|uniref:Uncharacterized protein n=1 Tax=Eumeta variegata TaxID=151549 RepID=A0A4C1U3W6_EUMVA|nr:hypothetical protein EVAR_14479_1 [Eumeta japonica]
MRVDSTAKTYVRIRVCGTRRVPEPTPGAKQSLAQTAALDTSYMEVRCSFLLMVIVLDFCDEKEGRFLLHRADALSVSSQLCIRLHIHNGFESHPENLRDCGYW